MRVADQQIYGTLLGNLQRSRLQILTAQQQISSQKRVETPADGGIEDSQRHHRGNK